MKQNQLIAQAHWKHQQNNIVKECSETGVTRKPGYASWEGWIGHSLNPIGCLFDTLSEVCLSAEDRAKLSHHLGKPVDILEESMMLIITYKLSRSRSHTRG